MVQSYAEIATERDAGRRVIAKQSDELKRVTRERDEALLRVEQLLEARRLDDSLHAEPDMDRCG
ncbi:hypothetical protein PBI_OMNICRON_46 [Mycobacterium phage Omnicron]|uniref:Uncharacterized protein n=1 Tax=Mycobacterium phage Omnicron TaxID=1541819 RepID=A0A088FUR0_9CAUD|nr:hypothetical protein PBI_OMNICRON_46 [Mycobacterium phage Omnicron]AIM50379.1 hypothetical protein PBI_OMNICRON_46 [Mycobacterium phage Omnicron]